jgi:predicted GNAT family acetyltransferase
VRVDKAAVTIVNNGNLRRWEARGEGEVVGYSEYREGPGRVTFTHTVVDPRYEGQGIGSRLARTAIDDAIARGLRITPYCPFIRAFLERHSEYDASVDYPRAAG